MSIPCNMTAEERAEWLERFPAYLSDEDEERAKGAFTRYIFYETWGRRNFREYYCWNCRCFEAVKGNNGAFIEDGFSYKNGEDGNCPRCGAKGRFVALGRYRSMSTLTEWRNIGFVREEAGALLLSAGNAVREYSFSNLDPAVEYYEKARYVVMPGKRQKWTRVRYWDGCWGEYGLQSSKTFTEPFPKTHYYGMSLKSGEVYWIGTENIDVSDMRYCCAEDFMRDFWGVNRLIDTAELEPVRGLVMYLGEYSRRPQLEMLYKLGHGDVIYTLLEDGGLDARVVNWRARTPAGFFRMDKRDYKVFAEKRGRYRDLVEYRRRTEAAGEMSYEDYWSLCAWISGHTDSFFERARAYGLPPVKLWRYLQEQAPIGAGGDGVFLRWTDYLDMAVKLERDLSFKRNLLPENLTREHDAALDLLDGVEEAKVAAGPGENYGKRYRRLKRMYAYSDGELKIVVPVNEADIEREGKLLRHCVGGYARRHVEGKTTILFLRYVGAPDQRYVTIEINDATHDIIQVHGYRNEADGAERPRLRHAAFFEEWLAWLRAGSPRSRNGKPVRQKRQEAKTA